MSGYDLTGSGIRAHIRRMAIPAATGFFCYTLFNMTDTFYAGYIDTAAQSALAFSFPPYFILLSFCVGIGQGVTAQLANALGKRRHARATYLFAQGLLLAAAVACGIWLLLLPLTEQIIALLGGSGRSGTWAVSYSRLIYAGAPLFLLTFLLNSALQAAGNTTAFRNSLLAAALLNIVLDPLLMFGWFGLPPLGVAGVALATLLTQAVSAVYLLLVLRRTVFAQRWRRVFLRPRRRILLTLSQQSAAPTGRMLGIGLFFFLVTAFLGWLDEDAVAAYGIALRIEQLFLLPTIGLEVALLAYAGQNLAAGNRLATRSAYRLCLRYGLLCMGLGAVLMVSLGKWLIALFNAEEAVVQHGYHYLLAASAVGPLYLFVNMGGAVLMGALRTFAIAVASLLRLLLLPLLFFWLLAVHFGWGTLGIWMGIVLANLPAAWWMHRRALCVIADK